MCFFIGLGGEGAQTDKRNSFPRYPVLTLKMEESRTFFGVPPHRTAVILKVRNLLEYTWRKP
jgi:hypothetical protein